VAALAAPKGAVHTVLIQGMKFVPESLKVKAGDKIVWVNKDIFPHTATATKEGFDSGVLQAGASWAFKSQRPGVFPYFCKLHPPMKGTVIVE
jgi:plastocyanin